METRVILFPNPMPYSEGLRFQNECVNRRLADEIPDTLILLEHTPVITLGIRAKHEHLLLSKQVLEKRGIEVHETPRGGDVTYHAPGQLVLYPIMKLSGQEADAHAFVGKLEKIAILTAEAFDVKAFRRKGKTGVWTDQGKLAAIGIRFKKWVSSHGMSFNVNLDLGGFDTIVPCGLHGEKVTSLREILGDQCPSMQEVRAVMMRQFERVMNRTVTTPELGRPR
ncbi:MAG: lipoyl(octanoyl) transferase LipB [bacterium]